MIELMVQAYYQDMERPRDQWDNPGYIALYISPNVAVMHNLMDEIFNDKVFRSREIRLSKMNRRIMFPSGAQMLFTHCEDVKNIYNYIGIHFNKIEVDALITDPEAIRLIEIMRSRINNVPSSSAWCRARG